MLGTFHLNALYDILKELHFLYQSEKIYSYLIENLMRAVDADAASIFLMDAQKKSLILRACTGPKKNVLDLVSEEIPFPLGVGVCGWVAQYNQPIIVDDASKDERFSAQVDSVTGYKTKSILCAPLANKDEILGVIEILNKKATVFNKNDLDFVAIVARQASIALQNSQLYGQLIATKNFNESVISNLTGGFITIDQKGLISHLNTVAEKLLQISNTDSVGKNYSEILKYYPDFHRELTWALNSKEKKVRQEFICNKPDQTQIKIGFSSFPILDSTQNTMGAAIIFQDITHFSK